MMFGFQTLPPRPYGMEEINISSSQHAYDRNNFIIQTVAYFVKSC